MPLFAGPLDRPAPVARVAPDPPHGRTRHTDPGSGAALSLAVLVCHPPLSRTRAGPPALSPFAGPPDRPAPVPPQRALPAHPGSGAALSLGCVAAPPAAVPDPIRDLRLCPRFARPLHGPAPDPPPRRAIRTHPGSGADTSLMLDFVILGDV